ncbi:hypothetical protein ACS0TY_015860 [Phlomoides rotata]
MVGKEEIEKKAAVDSGVKVATDGMEKKQDEPMTVVLKLDLHCEGCAKKVRRSISQLEGVEKVKVDCNAKKLIVTGNVDPTRLREGVETKTKKKVELISPQLPKKDGGSGGAAATAGGDKKADDKPDQKKTEENKADGDNKKPKEATVSTVVMKTKLHCDGCAHKIKRIIFKNFEGVHSVTIDLHKDLIMVKGTMEVEKLVTYLREKLKRGVDILPPPKKDNAAAGEKGKEVDGGDDKKEKGIVGSGGGGEEKKESGGDKKSEEAKVELNKMEHHSNNSQTHYAMPIPMPMVPTYNQSYGDHDQGMMMHHQYSNTGYMVPYGHGHGAPPLPPPTYLNMESNDMFSDENPNGCSVM